MEHLRKRSNGSPWHPQRPSHRRGMAYWMRQDRQAWGISQAALAQRMGVPIWKLSRLERGVDPIPARLIATIVAMLTCQQPSENSRSQSRGLTIVG
jgi:hypothetical protein